MRSRRCLSIHPVERRLAAHQHALDVLPGRAEQQRRRLPRDAGDVRRQQQPARALSGERQQRIVGRRRLGRIDIDGGAAEMTGREMPRRAPLRRRCRRAPPGSGPHPVSWRKLARRRSVPRVAGDQRHVQRHHVGGGQQLRRATSVGRRAPAPVHGRAAPDRRKQMRQPMRWKACATALPIVPNPTTPDQQALQSRRGCRPACGRGNSTYWPWPISASRPGEAAQQHRGRGHGVFGDRAVAAAGHVGDRNTEPRQRRPGRAGRRRRR